MKFRTVIWIMTCLFLVVFLQLNAMDSIAKIDRYTGSLYEGNYVWGGAMNLAWTELADSIVHETIELNTNNPQTLSTLQKLNNPVFTKHDLDEASYYIKSGYGQKTEEEINRESRKKFPSKSFDDLHYPLDDTDIISYAYFLKEVKYEHDFEKKDIKFLGADVEGFGDYGSVVVLDYKDKDHFLVGIQLKDQNDQIFLAKGYPMDKPDEIVARLSRKYPGDSNYPDRGGILMREADTFKAPILHLDTSHDYKEMLKIPFKNTQFRDYAIEIMKEKIKFDMDEKGARVENEGVIVGEASCPPPDNKYIPKVMILDKPYWVVMVRADSSNPYFILGVNNTKIMKSVK